jgi:Heterokaryon incompatibility protein (HET)
MTAPALLNQPLDSTRNEIRTIRLLPSTESSLVECMTDTVSLDDQPDYIALSYAWEDPSLTTPIVLNGVQVEVTTSLEAALRRIRSSRHVNDHVELWIDSICIDQCNTSEQSHQVQLMGKVFGQARMVHLWLGQEGKDSDLAIDLIEALGTGCLDPTDPRTWSRIPELAERRCWKAMTDSRSSPSMLEQAGSYKAAGGSTAVIRTSWDPAIFRVQGICCDRLAELESEEFRQRTDFWDRFLPAVGEQNYPTGIPCLQAVFRTLLADTLHGRDGKFGTRLHAHSDVFFSLAARFLSLLGRHGRLRNNRALEISADFDPIQAFLDWIDEDRHGRSDQAILAPLLGSGECYPQILWPKHKEWKRERPLLLEFNERAYSNTYGKSFFWTEKGYMGLGPAL